MLAGSSIWAPTTRKRAAKRTPPSWLTFWPAAKRYSLREPSKQHFRRFWGLESILPEDRDGVYHARYFGPKEQRLQVLLLDGRYNRDDEGDEGDTLGEKQWRWLAEELRKPAKLRLLVSGYQYFLPRDSKFETWTKFPKA